MTGYLLITILIAFGIKKLLALEHLRLDHGHFAPRIAAVSSLISGIITIATMFLLPLLLRFMETGLSAEAEHTKILTFAEDADMHKAKWFELNDIQFFRKGELEVTPNSSRSEWELSHAIDDGQMQILYQPQVDCRTGTIVGVEALLRWNHPTRGIIPPLEFIQLAEDTGLIIPLGEWVLRQSCRAVATLQKKTNRRFSLAVNISSRQFRRQDLTRAVGEALLGSGLSAQDLELELTENALMSKTEETLTQLNSIRSLGVRLAIDDFGTGFSTFQYLLNFKFDRLKIDRGFVSKCPHDANSCSVVRTVIAMAHGLGLTVVAEGVETVDQHAFLLRRHCDVCQGYLFARPIELASLEERLNMYEHSALYAHVRGEGLPSAIPQ
jgi:EAL domain-containing protein (putative c-di-GMP-specific phosphodiesterase class I)